MRIWSRLDACPDVTESGVVMTQTTPNGWFEGLGWDLEIYSISPFTVLGALLVFSRTNFLNTQDSKKQIASVSFCLRYFCDWHTGGLNAERKRTYFFARRHILPHAPTRNNSTFFTAPQIFMKLLHWLPIILAIKTVCYSSFSQFNFGLCGIKTVVVSFDCRLWLQQPNLFYW